MMLLVLAALLLAASFAATGQAWTHFHRALEGPTRTCRVPLCGRPCQGPVCDVHAPSTVDF